MRTGPVEGLRARLSAYARRTIATRHPVDHARTYSYARRAAVLVLVVGLEEPLELILFERTHDVAEHKGEICFPGGSIESGDSDPPAAALREAREELGIPPHDVTVLGCLDDVHTAGSNYIITPVVGHIKELPALVPDPLEVAKPLILRLDRLRAVDAWTIEYIDVRGELREFETHRVGDNRIWGATARILRSLLQVWHGVDA